MNYSFKKSSLLIIAIAISTLLSAQNQPTFYLRGLLDMWKKSSANTTTNRKAKYNALFPTAVRSNVVYSLSAASAWYYTKNPSDYTSYIDDSYLELCKRVDSTGISFVVNIAEIGNYPTALPESSTLFLANPGGYYMTVAQVEKVFLNTTNCKGIESGENFWNYNPTTVNMVIDLLRLCKKYNKTYVLGEGGWGYSSLLRFLNENYSVIQNEGLGKYFIPVFKNTKPYGALATQSAIFGAWVTGLTSNFGTWNDEWAWTYSSFRNANEFPIYNKADNNYNYIPFTHYLKSWLFTIAMGGNTAFMESMTFNRDATALPNTDPYLFPFIKGLAEHNIMPSRQAVLAKTKAIANPYGTYTLSDGTTATYDRTNLISYQTTVVPYKATSLSTYAEPFGLLYKNTYGIWSDTSYVNTGSVTDRFYNYASKYTGKNYLLNAVVREVLPNNPRYLLLPLLPNPAAASSVPAGIEQVDLCTLSSDNAVKTKFESIYPATPNENGAWAQEIDNSFFVINSHENANIDQNFLFNLGNTNIESLLGVMPFQNILFGKREGTDFYWFQSNGYAVANGTSGGQKYVCPIKRSTLAFKCKKEPHVRVVDGKGMYIRTWNAATNTMTLSIDHSGGAVNFYIYTLSDNKPYYVRPAGDSLSWSAQALASPAQVINVANIAELTKHLGSSTFYLAKGEYIAENGALNDSMQVYGGFRGDETTVDVAKREKQDLDNNGLIEPWEFKNQTIFRGNRTNKNTMATRAIVLDNGALIDGVLFTSLVGTAENGLITVGAAHAPGVVVSSTQGFLRNSIIDGAKSTFGRGVVMITSGSEVSNCLLQNDTVSSAYGGGIVYFGTSGGVLKNSVIRNSLANGSSSRGGAICADVNRGNQTQEYLVQNCLIYNNKADNGSVLRQDAFGTTGTPDVTMGCQFVHCTIFNNHSALTTALMDVNATSARLVNSIVFSAQYDPFRTLSGGLMTVVNCVSNNAITNATSTSTGIVNETNLANYKFIAPFTTNYTVLDRRSPDYSTLLSAKFMLQDNNSVGVTNPGVELLSSNIPTGNANIIPSTDLYGTARIAGGYTLGAYQLGTESGFVSGVACVKEGLLQIYPNPAKEVFYLSTGDEATVNIFSLTGVLVKSVSLSGSRSVNIADLAAGAYIVKANVGGALQSNVLIKK